MRSCSASLTLVASIACLALACCSTAGADLILHYSFDEAATGSANVGDLGPPPAADGVFQNGATRTHQTPGGISAGALDLTAPGADYVTTSGDADKVDALEQMTITFWLNYRGAPANRDILISNDSILGDASDPKGWDILVTNNNGRGPFANRLLLQFTMRQYGENGGSSGTGIVAGFSGEFDAAQKWLFAAVTFDGDDSGAATFFGGDEFNAAAQVGGTTILNRTNGQNLGGFTVGFGSVSGTGLKSPAAWLDDVRVYDEVLPLAAIEEVRLLGLGVPEPASGYAFAALFGVIAIKRTGRRS